MKLRTIKITLFTSLIGLLLTNCEKEPCTCNGKFITFPSGVEFTQEVEVECGTDEIIDNPYYEGSVSFRGCE